MLKMLVSFHKLSEENQCDIGKRALWSSGGTENTGWVSTGLKMLWTKGEISGWIPGLRAAWRNCVLVPFS